MSEQHDLFRQHLIDYQTVFGSEHGKRVFFDLMERFHFSSTVRGDTPEDTYYREGQRSVVLFLLKQMALTPEHLAKLFTQSNAGVFDDN